LYLRLVTSLPKALALLTEWTLKEAPESEKDICTSDVAKVFFFFFLGGTRV
jgi:hypothetical protein